MGKRIKLLEATYGPGSFNPNHAAFYDPDYYASDDTRFDEKEYLDKLEADARYVKQWLGNHGTKNINTWGEARQEGDRAVCILHVDFEFDHPPTAEELDRCDDAYLEFIESVDMTAKDSPLELVYDDGDVNSFAVVGGKRVPAGNGAVKGADKYIYDQYMESTEALPDGVFR